MKDGCGFLFVRYKRHFCTELISWEYVACPLSGIKRRQLVGGWLNTSCIVFSIRAIASVRYREVVRSWEGPLWEVPLYSILKNEIPAKGLLLSENIQNELMCIYSPTPYREVIGQCMVVMM